MLGLSARTDFGLWGYVLNLGGVAAEILAVGKIMVVSLPLGALFSPSLRNSRSESRIHHEQHQEHEAGKIRKDRMTG